MNSQNNLPKPRRIVQLSGGQRLALVALLSVTMLMPVLWGTGHASASTGVYQAATQTPVPANNPAGGVTGNNAPSPVGTSASNNAPPGVGTNLPAPLPTGDAAQPATGGNTNAPGGTAGTTTPGNDFPWLPVAVVAGLIVLGLIFAAMRQRRPAAAAIGVAPVRGASDVRHVSTSTARPTAPVATAATAAGVGIAPVLPATVRCPNCGATNSTNEKFCRDCGEDLRPAIAQAAAAAAPAAPVTPVAPVVSTEVVEPAPATPAAPVAPTSGGMAAGAPVAAGAAAAAAADMAAGVPGAGEEVDADTPYLETMDRVDDQLEFVLSRSRIAIGTAAGNDIVIDAEFKGWQTVSPQHAELRREPEGFSIVDRDSENGTYVNEMRTGENILADGDLVRLGDVRFVFRVPHDEA